MSEDLGLLFLTRKDGKPVVIVKAAIVKWALDDEASLVIVLPTSPCSPATASDKHSYTKIDTLDGHFQVVQETPSRIATLWAAA
jgi:hypothetical protein